MQSCLLALQSIVALDDATLVRQIEFVTHSLTQHRLLSSGVERSSAAAGAVFSRCVGGRPQALSVSISCQ